MKTLLKLGLLATAGYLLWREYAAGAQEPGGAEQPGVAAPGAGEAAGAAPAAPPSATPTLVGEAAAAAGEGPLLNYDQWAYYYRQVRGVTAPDYGAVFPGAERSYRMTVDEWWSGLVAYGLAGGVA